MANAQQLIMLGIIIMLITITKQELHVIISEYQATGLSCKILDLILQTPRNLKKNCQIFSTIIQALLQRFPLNLISLKQTKQMVEI